MPEINDAEDFTVAPHRKLTKGELRIVEGFRRFMYECRCGSQFTLWNVQGAVRLYNRGIPDRQMYVVHLRQAADVGWIKLVDEGTQTYNRLPHRGSRKQQSSFESRILKDRIVAELEGRDWLD